MELEGPSSFGCSMCHRVEIKNQRINRVCCVTKRKAFLSSYVCTHRKTYCTNETQLYVPSHIYCLLPSSLSYGFVWFIVGVKKEVLVGVLTPLALGDVYKVCLKESG